MQPGMIPKICRLKLSPIWKGIYMIKFIYCQCLKLVLVGMPLEEVVKVSRNYQITIPAKIRQKFQIKEGELVVVIYDENEHVIKIKPLNQS
jgi:looped-hinge helix DNA binding domain, AbrB family